MAATGYEIRVKGRLSDTVTSVFEDFTASVKPAETTLRGEIRDQAELTGLLEQLQSLGLELIEVKRLDQITRSDRCALGAAGIGSCATGFGRVPRPRGTAGSPSPACSRLRRPRG